MRDTIQNRDVTVEGGTCQPGKNETYADISYYGEM